MLGATNTPRGLDAAIRRRSEKRIYIPLPDKETRTYMLKLHIGDTPNDLTDSDLEKMRRGQIFLCWYEKLSWNH